MGNVTSAEHYNFKPIKLLKDEDSGSDGFVLDDSLWPSGEPKFQKTEFNNQHIQSFDTSQLKTSLWTLDPMCY